MRKKSLRSLRFVEEGGEAMVMVVGAYGFEILYLGARLWMLRALLLKMTGL